MRNDVGKLARCFYYSDDGRIVNSKIGIIMDVLINNTHNWVYYEVLIDGIPDTFPSSDIEVIEENDNDQSQRHC